MFFNSHVCNEYCRDLGLLNPRTTDKIPSKFSLIAKTDESTIRSH